nr:hypothetical protein [uncultured Clostridium sp.]
MNIKSVIAYRIDDIINVLVLADLPRPCDYARIYGTYPGNIYHVADPGKAEVYIEFYESPESCSTVIQPWLSSVQIKDTAYNEVDVFVDGGSVVSVPIFNYSMPQPTTFYLR